MNFGVFLWWWTIFSATACIVYYKGKRFGEIFENWTRKDTVFHILTLPNTVIVYGFAMIVAIINISAKGIYLKFKSK